MELNNTMASLEHPDFRSFLSTHAPSEIRDRLLKKFDSGEFDADIPVPVVERKRDLAACLAATGLSGRQFKHTFDTYTPETHSEAQALNLVRDLCGRIAINERTRGIMLWGTSGTGKNHLMDALVIDTVTAHNVSVVSRFAMDIEGILYEECRAGTDTHDTRLEEQMRNARLVCIGDLHHICGLVGTKSEWIVRVIYRVINQTAETGLPIVCATSNKPLAYFDDRIDEAFGSRLAGVMHWHKIAGRDRRRKQRMAE